MFGTCCTWDLLRDSWAGWIYFVKGRHCCSRDRMFYLYSTNPKLNCIFWASRQSINLILFAIQLVSDCKMWATSLVPMRTETNLILHEMIWWWKVEKNACNNWFFPVTNLLSILARMRAFTTLLLDTMVVEGSNWDFVMTQHNTCCPSEKIIFWQWVSGFGSAILEGWRDEFVYHHCRRSLESINRIIFVLWHVILT